MSKLRILWQCSFFAGLGAILILLSPRPAERDGTPYAHHDEWKPSIPLLESLEELLLQPGTGQREAMARLKPHLEEALRTLTRIEQQRGLSEKERTLEENVRTLLAEIKEVG